ncbi:MAG: Fic family protein [Acidimicrobiales bacterium]
MAGTDRSGYYVHQPTGYSAFVPRPLPPAPALDLGRMAGSLSRADQAVGRLDGTTRLLPDRDLFLAMYVRREALLSSQIEGTECTLDDVLSFDLDPSAQGIPHVDVREVVNYIAAMSEGLARLKTLPISSRLLREVHARLLAVGRGLDRQPGELRSSQNWIGPPGCSLSQATFVPPPVDDMTEAMSDLEKFIAACAEPDGALPLLVVCGLVHAQFETIHPFLDGNGRIGRLLITLLLCEREVLSAPVLYLSTYLRRERTAYFDLLTQVRFQGDWEAWLEFFLEGVRETAVDATETAQRINSLREDHRRGLEAAGATMNDLTLLDKLFTQPLVNARWVGDALQVTPPTANAVLARFVKAGVLREMTGRARNRIFRFDDYLALFDQPIVNRVQDETGSS